MPQANPNRTGPPLKHAIFLLLLTVMVYAQSLTFPFLRYDDTPFIVENVSLRQWSSLPSFFSPAARAPVAAASANASTTSFYRPVQNSWLLVNYKLLGARPALWRLVAIALYAVGVVLLWRLTWKLTHNDFVALAGASLYALHPMHVEGVVWISGAAVEPLVSTFFFAGFLAYLRWRESGKWLWLTACGIFTLCALWSKETGAALPVLIFAHALLFGLGDFRAEASDSGAEQRGQRYPPGRMIALALTMAAPVSIYATLRSSVTGALVVSQAQHGWHEVFLTAPLMLARYLHLALWPFPLGNWYDIPLITSPSANQLYLPLAACVTFGVLTMGILLRRRLSGFFLLWWLVPLAVPLVALRSFLPFERMHDRYAFIPLAGLCVIVAGILDRLPSRSSTLFGFRSSSAIALALLTALLGALTAAQADTWRSDKDMYAQAVRACPTCLRPLMLLGGWLASEGDIDGALALDRRSIVIAPDKWEPQYMYGRALFASGDKQGGLLALDRATQLAPRETMIYLGYSDALVRSGDPEAAMRVLQRGMSVAEYPQILQQQLLTVQAFRDRSKPPHP